MQPFKRVKGNADPRETTMFLENSHFPLVLTNKMERSSHKKNLTCLQRSKVSDDQ